MSQSVSLPKGYKALVPIAFRDDHGRSHAPLVGVEIEVGDEEIVSANMHEDRGIELEAKEVGQTQICVTASNGEEEGDQKVVAQLMVSVTPERQQGERDQNGPTRLDFALDQIQFKGRPKPADPDRQRERERRREKLREARGEAEDTNEEAKRQDEQRATLANQGKSPEQIALEARGPANPLEEGGPEQPNRLGAMGAGRSPSIAAGTTADRPQDNPDDPNLPHNPGNQGGGDTMGRMLSRPGDPKTADERDKKQEEAKAEDEDLNDKKAQDDKKDDKAENKSQSAQQRGGAATSGTPTSAPGSRRG
jgi:hypothetical protein